MLVAREKMECLINKKIESCNGVIGKLLARLFRI